MQYITTDDLLARITQQRLEQITDSDTTLIDTAESTALAMIRDYIHPYYDVDTIYSVSGTDRHLQVVRWTVSIVLYILYERIADVQLPDRIVRNYEDTLALLENIADGKQSVLLPAIEEEGVPETKFRGGSFPPRSH